MKLQKVRKIPGLVVGQEAAKDTDDSESYRPLSPNAAHKTVPSKSMADLIQYIEGADSWHYRTVRQLEDRNGLQRVARGNSLPQPCDAVDLAQ